jgi:urocanate hydratase
MPEEGKPAPILKILPGKVFVTSGLGGMSGAQPKATVIAGGICLIAEVNPKALKTRHEQGWVDEVFTDLDALIGRMKIAVAQKRSDFIGISWKCCGFVGRNLQMMIV